jgi:hypothetical protein
LVLTDHNHLTLIDYESMTSFIPLN